MLINSADVKSPNSFTELLDFIELLTTTPRVPSKKVSLAIFVLTIYGRLCKFVHERWQEVFERTISELNSGI